MKLSYFTREVYYALIANKVRSGLTVLGIVIGIASVIAMVAIGQGSKNQIQASITSLGSNLITISAGAKRTAGGFQVNMARGSTQTLTQDDIDSIKNLDGVKFIDAELSSRYQIIGKGTNSNTNVMGTTSSYLTIRNLEIENGDFITEQNIKNMAKVAVIGPTVAEDLFGVDVDPVGETIKIKSISFKIIGVTKAKGGNGFNSQDDMIFVPITTAQHYLAGNKKYVGNIAIQATDDKIMTTLQEEITTILLDNHKITDSTKADFTVTNQADMLATASSVTGTFTTLLGSVAAISLIVGGIGIMNMMLTTVTERTREIGLRKSIGAKRRDINRQFLAEAVALTFLGGFFGVLLGFLVAFLITKFGGTTAVVSLSSVILAFSVSALIGIVFGYYPANRASKLNPIEALRYE